MLCGNATALDTGYAACGYWPVRMAGTAICVYGATVVVFRYQVEPPASAAKVGNNVASTCPCPSSREDSGSSSMTTMTTRTSFFTCTSAADFGPPVNTASVTGENPRK